MNEMNLILAAVACLPDVQGGIFWPRTLHGEVAEESCAEAGPFYRVGPLARRQCNEIGVWEEADFTGCTLEGSASEPFLLLWLVVEADEIQDDEITFLEKEVHTHIWFLVLYQMPVLSDP